MSTIPLEAACTTGEPIANLLFDYPGADIILRSHDSYHFRVPKVSIVDTSPVLCDIIRRTLASSGTTNADVSLPVVQLPESSQILHSLLTFIFLVTPRIPSTHEEIMELLSVAQKYQMGTVLTHIRGSIARQSPLPTRLEPALHIYSLAQKYGLRPEALQTARTILTYPMTIEDLDDKLDIMPGASLYELWKYHERVQDILESSLTEFTVSRAHGTLTGLHCTELSFSGIPSWLHHYIESIGDAPNLFDPIEFNIVMARHVKEKASKGTCRCVSIPRQTMRDFWEALASVVNDSFEKAESSLSLVREHEDHIISTTPPSENFDVSDTNLIIRSSDLVNFRVHKSVLAMASPFFKDLLSLPQPSDGEMVDGLPVVQLSEDSELLNNLVSILYPLHPVVPNSYDKVLYLLAACQKYEMVSVQSFIRAEVSRGEFPAPKGAPEVFSAYTIASSKKLIPEMENAARLTLDYPLTFEIIGERLRMFEGRALRDLVNFRKRCRPNLVACVNSFLKFRFSGPSEIWIGCPEVMPLPFESNAFIRRRRILPLWLNQLLSRCQDQLRRENFALPLDIHLRIRREYFTALQSHATTCTFCSAVHIRNGLTFCTELENKLGEARDKESVRPHNDTNI